MTRSAPATPRSVNPAATILLPVVVWSLGALAGRYVGVWVGIGGTAVVLGLAVWVTHRKALAGLLVPRGRDLLLGLAAGVVMTAATYLLYPPFVGMMPDLAAGTRELYHLFNSGPAPIRMTLLPLVILAEEVVWRGLVQSAAEPRVGRIPAAVLTAGLYSLAHLPVGSPLLAGIAWCCGLYWGLLRAGTGSLWVPLLAHALWDALVMAAFPLRA